MQKYILTSAIFFIVHIVSTLPLLAQDDPPIAKPVEEIADEKEKEPENGNKTNNEQQEATVKDVAKDVKDIKKKVESFETKLTEQAKTLEGSSNRVISFGLTAGPRLAFSKEETTNAFIDVSDSTLQFDDVDKGSFVISASVIASPFINAKAKNKQGEDTEEPHWSTKVFFMLNIDIAELGGDSFKFNQSVDGGIGAGYFLDKTRNFGIGFTFDKITNRILHDSFVDKEGQKIPLAGKPGEFVTKINRDDDDFFQNDNDLAFSLWFVYRFGALQ